MIRNFRLISKFIMSSHAKQIITIHILPNISRSKDNLRMKFGQLVVYNMIIFFLKSHIQNVMEKLVSESFLKYHNCAYLWISSLKCCTICFYQVNDYQDVLKLRGADDLLLPNIGFFKKTRRRPRTNLSDSFSESK